MPEPVSADKMRYLAEMREKLLAHPHDPELYRTRQNLVVRWRGGCSGATRIREVDLVSDENAGSTGYGEGVSPGHTFVAGLVFSHMTQWGRAAAACGAVIDDLQEEVWASFDRRGEYLYEEGYPHPGFTDITFEVRIRSSSPPQLIRRFVAWAERSPPHATLRRAVRLVGIFRLNGEHLATAVYHADRTEWRLS